jgi:hypothetical protein
LVRGLRGVRGEDPRASATPRGRVCPCVYINAWPCHCPGCSSSAQAPGTSEALSRNRERSRWSGAEQELSEVSPCSSSSSLGLGTNNHGEGPGTVLRQGGAQQGLLDAGGGHAPHRLHSEVRPRQLARPAQASRYVQGREPRPPPARCHACRGLGVQLSSALMVLRLHP